MANPPHPGHSTFQPSLRNLYNVKEALEEELAWVIGEVYQSGKTHQELLSQYGPECFFWRNRLEEMLFHNQLRIADILDGGAPVEILD